MKRIAILAAFLMAAALPAQADKDCKRLQVQVTALQGQIADMQRKAADSVTELQRLTELVAEQNALLKAALDAGRQQDEAVAAVGLGAEGNEPGVELLGIQLLFDAFLE